MSCRIQCQPAPESRRHLPTFGPPDLPDGHAECLVCRDWITAVDLFGGVCPGAPSVEPPPAPTGDRRETEREATLSMIARCGEHQL